MSIVLSVLTPDWLLQVSDAPESQPRTVKIQRAGTPGLLGWAGPIETLGPLIDAIAPRAAIDPADLAEQVKTEAMARVPLEAYATALIAGWGVSPEGHKASYRWRVTNFEDEETADDVTFSVDGTWLVPSYAQPGGMGKSRARRSFSVQVSATVALPDPILRRLDRLPRDLKKDPAPNALAIELAGLVTEVLGDGPVTLALLRPDGSLEGGILAGGALTPLAAPREDGIWRLNAG